MGSKAELELVRRFWALYQDRRWCEVHTLLSPEAQCRWWATRECFEGAAAVVHVNAIYPEGWTIHLLELNPLADGRLHSLVRVDQDGRSFYANSFFTLEPGGESIAEIDEYWADLQAAPDWRRGGRLPGLVTMGVDRRPGLDLHLADRKVGAEQSRSS